MTANDPGIAGFGLGFIADDPRDGGGGAWRLVDAGVGPEAFAAWRASGATWHEFSGAPPHAWALHQDGLTAAAAAAAAAAIATTTGPPPPPLRVTPPRAASPPAEFAFGSSMVSGRASHALAFLRAMRRPFLAQAVYDALEEFVRLACVPRLAWALMDALYRDDRAVAPPSWIEDDADERARELLRVLMEAVEALCETWAASSSSSAPQPARRRPPNPLDPAADWALMAMCGGGSEWPTRKELGARALDVLRRRVPPHDEWTVLDVLTRRVPDDPLAELAAAPAAAAAVRQCCEAALAVRRLCCEGVVMMS